jgi:hypothetical protein
LFMHLQTYFGGSLSPFSQTVESFVRADRKIDLSIASN